MISSHWVVLGVNGGRERLRDADAGPCRVETGRERDETGRFDGVRIGRRDGLAGRSGTSTVPVSPRPTAWQQVGAEQKVAFVGRYVS